METWLFVVFGLTQNFYIFKLLIYLRISFFFFNSWLNNIKLALSMLLYLAQIPLYIPLSALSHIFKIPLFFFLNQPFFLFVLFTYLFFVYNNLLIKWFILLYQSLYIQNYYQKFLRICSFPF